jgi:hypothetical protein
LDILSPRKKDFPAFAWTTGVIKLDVPDVKAASGVALEDLRSNHQQSAEDCGDRNENTLKELKKLQNGTHWCWEYPKILPISCASPVRFSGAAAAEVEPAHSGTLGSALVSALRGSPPRFASSHSDRTLPVCSPTQWTMPIPCAQKPQS